GSMTPPIMKQEYEGARRSDPGCTISLLRSTAYCSTAEPAAVLPRAFWHRTRAAASEQRVERFAERPHGDELARSGKGSSIGGIAVGLGHDAALESHLGGFAHAKRRLRDAAHLARQTHFAEHGGPRRNRTIADARRNRGEDAEV